MQAPAFPRRSEPGARAAPPGRRATRVPEATSVTRGLCGHLPLVGRAGLSSSASHPVEHRDERGHSFLMSPVFLRNDSALDSARSRGIRSAGSPPALSEAQCPEPPACGDVNRGRYPMDSLPTKRRTTARRGTCFVSYGCHWGVSDPVYRINGTRGKVLPAERPLASVPVFPREETPFHGDVLCRPRAVPAVPWKPRLRNGGAFCAPGLTVGPLPAPTRRAGGEVTLLDAAVSPAGDPAGTERVRGSVCHTTREPAARGGGCTSQEDTFDRSGDKCGWRETRRGGDPTRSWYAALA